MAEWCLLRAEFCLAQLELCMCLSPALQGAVRLQRLQAGVQVRPFDTRVLGAVGAVELVRPASRVKEEDKEKEKEKEDEKEEENKEKETEKEKTRKPSTAPSRMQSLQGKIEARRARKSKSKESPEGRQGAGRHSRVYRNTIDAGISLVAIEDASRPLLLGGAGTSTGTGGAEATAVLFFHPSVIPLTFLPLRGLVDALDQDDAHNRAPVVLLRSIR